MKNKVLQMDNVYKEFVSGGISDRKTVKAVNGISCYVLENETYSLVGESGCGKSTTGRLAIGLLKPTYGDVLYRNIRLNSLSDSKMKPFRPKLQMIFQDPYTALNRRMTIGKIIEEPLKINKISTNSKERHDMVAAALEKVGIREDQYYRYPHEFSGGQRQRIGLARAMILNPELIVCDEPVSALDVSIQSQVLNLMKKLQQDSGMSYLFISHNMSVVRYISDRVGVMYLGSLVEEAPTDELFSHPAHPYTKALLSAIPVANPHISENRIVMKGEIPSPLNIPEGCPFHSRCSAAREICCRKMPKITDLGGEHRIRCWLYSAK